MKKKLLSLTLATVLMLGAFSAVYAGTVNAQAAENEQPKAVKAAYGENANFSDLKSTNWAYEAVNAMSQKGIVKGYADGTFKPQNTVTYAEFIKMALIAATGEDVGNAEAVNEETGAKQHWALNYYNKALELGYFGQTDIKALQLGNEIPRSDMALIVSNILGDVKIDNYSDLEAKLSDVNSETENDYDIIKAYASGIITGYQDGTFKPEGTLTRAESSTVIYRILEESARVLPNVSGTVLEDVTTDIEGNPIDNEGSLENRTMYDLSGLTDVTDIRYSELVKNVDVSKWKAENYRPAPSGKYIVKTAKELNVKMGITETGYLYVDYAENDSSICGNLYGIKDGKMYASSTSSLGIAPCSAGWVKKYEGLDISLSTFEYFLINNVDGLGGHMGYEIVFKNPYYQK